ncbi:MAG TPA: diacylglycerol kinase family protein [Pirellulaceae bacterium]|nr:diacylglycerol kinase family protein [Pirellulaceae bacterium]
MDQKKRVLVSLNPNAGARSGQTLVDTLGDRLAGRGFQVETITDIDHLAAEAEAALASGQLRAVISAGGDGTAALIANRTPQGTPIAVFPLGTENLLAKYLEVTADIDCLVDTVSHGKMLTLDAGEANGRLFLLMVGCGFDADVVRRLHSERTGHIHHLSYAKPILDSIWNYEYPELRVYCDTDDTGGEDSDESDSLAISARWVFVGNLPRYAGGLRILPDADGNDGFLDLCTFKEGSIWNGLRYLSGVIMGQHQTWEDCTTKRTRCLRIESEAGEVPFQMDGDPGGVLPVAIRILPDRLTLLVPHGLARETSTTHDTATDQPSTVLSSKSPLAT